MLLSAEARDQGRAGNKLGLEAAVGELEELPFEGKVLQQPHEHLPGLFSLRNGETRQPSGVRHLLTAGSAARRSLFAESTTCLSS